MKDYSDHRPMLGVGLRILSAAAFAVMATLVKRLSAEGLPEFQIIFFRSLFGLLPVLAGIALLRKPELLLTKRPGVHAVRAAIGLASISFMFAGITRLPLQESTAIGFSSPLFATLMSAVLLSEPIGRSRLAAITVGFIGVLIVMQPTTALFTHMGSVYAAIAAVLSAAVSVTVRQIARTEHSLTITFYFMLSATVATGLIMPLMWFTPTPQMWIEIVGLGIAGGVMQLLLTAALRFGPVSLIVPFDYTQLLFVTGLALLVFGEQLALHTFVGALVIIGSGIAIFYREAARKVTPTQIAASGDEN